jgi:hypothetical protein
MGSSTLSKVPFAFPYSCFMSSIADTLLSFYTVKVLALAAAVETCDFLLTWKLIKEMNLSSFPGLRASLQNYILSLLNITFQSAKLTTVMEMTDSVSDCIHITTCLNTLSIV